MTFKKIHFVTDSTSDIPADLAAQQHIGVVPCFINYNNQSFADDGVQLVREKYYEDMPNIHPLATTSAPAPGIAKQIIERTFEGADHLIILTAPERLSSIYNSMRLGSASLPQDRVSIIDSGTTAMALGWQVLLGKEVADETGSLETVMKALEGVRKNSRLFAALATLDYLRESGRVGWAAAGIAKILNIKPMLQVEDGEVSSIGQVRTFKRAVDEMVERARAYAPLDRLAILHTNNLESAHEIRQRLGDIAPAGTIISNLNPSVGTHIGPGGVAVVPVSRKWRDSLS